MNKELEKIRDQFSLAHRECGPFVEGNLGDVEQAAYKEGYNACDRLYQEAVEALQLVVRSITPISTEYACWFCDRGDSGRKVDKFKHDDNCIFGKIYGTLKRLGYEPTATV